MTLRVTSSMTARHTIRDLNNGANTLSALQRKMSSGMEITRPSDNPYGTSKALALRGEVEGLQQYQSNVGDGTSWLNASDAALSKINDAVQRIRELLIQGGTDSAGPAAREAAATEIDQLIESVKQEANVQYAGRYIFSGTATTTRPYDVGSDVFAGNADTIQREIGPGVMLDINVDVSGVFGNGQGAADNRLLDTLRDISDDLRSGDGDRLRGTDIVRLDASLDALNAVRADVGARTNRLTIADGRLAALEENSTDLLSKVQDADTVKTLIEYTTQQSAYNMALKAGANVVQSSLMDFLR
ncbi:flagellar hook-associated protein FlgL [Conexibacter sp. JD483]|uniref:flagellar hook-associated protein FlgL n=1 Tax=unclassified Conexibacter TaxID=2627773 RepID=UPI00271EF99B|nr:MULTISPECIES: flagellar hook-associated protein FlgL [unclassified Conexibacter]MDO8184468.1 flagellar hook-associated protein FlgL [Conexibacter sp. CPCC 205706]MDO8197774.1 flagellar hook-associated protein FlgL [Conexibacter sp. CPCC 205762]MDR9368090.1 flagellar hook-associated protein FlgL [Conexibacter sp. JD483]